MSPMLLLAPPLLAFEVWQLVLGERYLGIKQIERDTDPRTLGLSEVTAFFWSMGILIGWAWAIALIFQSQFRAQAISILFVSMVGYALRRSCGLKWILVILTLEGAVRVGMLMSVIGIAWRQL
jgi:hypothetical protein